MTRRLCVAAALLWTSVSAPPVSAGHPSPALEEFLGQWRITRVVGVTAFGDTREEAELNLGGFAYISPDAISLYPNPSACRPMLGWVRDHRRTRDLLEEDEALELTPAFPAETWVLYSENCHPVYWLDRQHIVVSLGGAYYKAERVQPEALHGIPSTVTTQSIPVSSFAASDIIE